VLACTDSPALLLLLLLYVQVRCQAGGLPVSAVLQQLMGAGNSPHVVMRQLYAGVVSASLASVAVGESCMHFHSLPASSAQQHC
jgi:hypothetical protein